MAEGGKGVDGGWEVSGPRRLMADRRLVAEETLKDRREVNIGGGREVDILTAEGRLAEGRKGG